MTDTWSPRCHKCGGRGNVQVTPPENMIFAGRLRPEATKPYVFGTRVRCTRCNTWFILGHGTEWRANKGERMTHVPEPVPDVTEPGGEDLEST